MKRILIISAIVLSGIGVYFAIPSKKPIDPLLGFTSFSTGQVGPLLDSRNDYAKYASACRTLENMFVTVQGPAMRRSGTKMIAEVKDGNFPVRLLPFEASNGDRYAIEAGNNYMRFFKDGSMVMDDNDVNSQYEITTPFTTADLNNIQFAQTDNQLYLVDGNHIPQILSRYGQAEWSCDDAVFESGPFLPENDTAITITPLATTNLALGRTYSASSTLADGSYPASQVFDNIVTGDNGWDAAEGNVTNQWISVQFNSPQIISCVKIQPYKYTGSYCGVLRSKQNVRHCKIEASNDGNSWSKLPVTQWEGRCSVYDVNEIEIEQIDNFSEWAKVVVDNNTSYSYYRVYAYDNWGSTCRLSIKEIQMTRADSNSSGGIGIIDLVADSNIFNPGHVGSIWEISQKRELDILKGTLTSTVGVDVCSSNTEYFSGGYSFVTSGTWNATVMLERSTNDGVTWDTALTPLNSVNYNNVAETENDYAIYRVVISDWVSGSCSYTFTIHDQYNHGVVKISGYIGPSEVEAIVLRPLVAITGSTGDMKGLVTLSPDHKKSLPAGTVFVGENSNQAVSLGAYNLSQNSGDWSRILDYTGYLYFRDVTGPNFVNGEEIYIGSHNVGHFLATPIPLVINTKIDLSTNKWREGSWSDYRGWPKCVQFHQQRLCYADTNFYPQTIWFGEANPDDFLNFDEGTLDTDAFTIALMGNNIIKWLLSQDVLFIGMSESVGRYGDSSEPITPTSPNYREQSKSGSANTRAVLAGDAILYVERGYRRIREFVYSLQYDKYLSPDLTVLSDTITNSGIRDIAFQLRPDPILWCILNDGNVATLTYQKDQEISGWSKQITNGSFESIIRTPGLNSEDDIWLSVKRGTSRYIELLQPRDWGTDQNNCWFVDSGLSYSGVAKKTFSGLDHLSGVKVSVYADGNALADVNVDANGTFVIDVNASNVVAGLSYTSKLETMPIVIPTPVGTSAAMNSKIATVNFDLLNTGYCKVVKSDGSYRALDLSDPRNITGRQSLYTSTDSTKRPNVSWDYSSAGNNKATIRIESDRPYPLILRAIYPFVEVQP